MTSKPKAEIKMSRVWAMPNKWTFQIPPIADLLLKYVGDGKGWIDPFAGKYSPAELTNDLNPAMPTKYHLDAIEFLEQVNGKYIGGIFDPPYSLRQIMECYQGFGIAVDKQFATTKFYKVAKDLLSRKIVPGGLVISCGWNSIGMGKRRGFDLIEILLVCHGRSHNDTIVTVERKNQTGLADFQTHGGPA